jgi:DNA-binding NarL/FixJ family response regulator
LASARKFKEDAGSRRYPGVMPATSSSDNYGAQATVEFQPAAVTSHPIGGRVVIVDRHALVAQSLAMVLAAASVTTYISNDASLEGVVRQVRAFDPDLVLIDAGSDDAVELVRAVARMGTKVLSVTDGSDRMRVAACIEAGANGAVSTLDPVDRLLATIRETVAGRRVMPATAEQDLLGELQTHRRDRAAQLARFNTLSTRESEVLQELMSGKSAADIAQECYVSIATIRSQIKAILRKLEVNSQLAAVALAYQVGWSRASSRATFGSSRFRDVPTPRR